MYDEWKDWSHTLDLPVDDTPTAEHTCYNSESKWMKQKEVSNFIYISATLYAPENDYRLESVSSDWNFDFISIPYHYFS